MEQELTFRHRLVLQQAAGSLKQFDRGQEEAPAPAPDLSWALLAVVVGCRPTGHGSCGECVPSEGLGQTAQRRVPLVEEDQEAEHAGEPDMGLLL